eukprot:Rhum_TRINITY_DN15292_c7_g2::Rhum_TRINITY_DN15292_c7_g2_i1::g.148632::m.148632
MSVYCTTSIASSLRPCLFSVFSNLFLRSFRSRLEVTVASFLVFLSKISSSSIFIFFCWFCCRSPALRCPPSCSAWLSPRALLLTPPEQRVVADLPRLDVLVHRVRVVQQPRADHKGHADAAAHHQRRHAQPHAAHAARDDRDPRRGLRAAHVREEDDKDAPAVEGKGGDQKVERHKHDLHLLDADHRVLVEVVAVVHLRPLLHDLVVHVDQVVAVQLPEPPRRQRQEEEKHRDVRHRAEDGDDELLRARLSLADVRQAAQGPQQDAGDVCVAELRPGAMAHLVHEDGDGQRDTRHDERHQHRLPHVRRVDRVDAEGVRSHRHDGDDREQEVDVQRDPEAELPRPTRHALHALLTGAVAAAAAAHVGLLQVGRGLGRVALRGLSRVALDVLRLVLRLRRRLLVEGYADDNRRHFLVRLLRMLRLHRVGGGGGGGASGTFSQ